MVEQEYLEFSRGHGRITATSDESEFDKSGASATC